MASACEHLDCQNYTRFNFDEFILCFNIQHQNDFEKLIIYAISYNKPNIIQNLFNYYNINVLMDKFKMGINSLYSYDCLSLIPSIKIDNSNNNNDHDQNEKSMCKNVNLFSESVIESSKQIEFDNHIQEPIHSTLKYSTIKYLCATNCVYSFIIS